MSKKFETTIVRSMQLEGEENFLRNVVNDLTNNAHKETYANWLEEQGDQKRATFLYRYLAAIQSKNVEEFPSFDDVPESWSHVIGARISKEILKTGFGRNLDSWLTLAKPAFKYETDYQEYEVGFDGDTSPIGTSKLFGLPDLPPNTSWPKQKDCNSLYDTNSGIDPELNCGFVCQINLEEFSRTHAAHLFPDKGLISIFSCTELDHIGMVDAYVTFTSDTTNLVRLEPPNNLHEDEANQLLNPHAFRMLEMLELPSAGSNSPFEAIRWDYNHEAYDDYNYIQKRAEMKKLSSFLGYTRPTTGEDPLPGADYSKLICIPNTVGIILHFCIKNDDLASGRFDRVELAWVDFD